MNPRAEISRPGAAAFAWGVLAVLAAAVSLFAFHIRECFVDDAFIGLQYVENLLAGHGFVFHPGQKPVEAVTNIGWLLTLAPLSAAIGSALAAKVAGYVLLLSSLATTMLLGKSLAKRLEDSCLREIPPHSNWGPFGLTLTPTILLASNFEFIYFPLAGMETALLAMLLLLMACVTLRRPYGLALPLLGTLAFLVHPEAALVYPLYAAISWIRSSVGRDSRRQGPSISADNRWLESPPAAEREIGRRLIAGSVIFVVAIGAITAIRFAYFGDVVPNTFHSKPGSVQLAVENAYGFLMGQNTNVAFPITGWLAIPVLLLGHRRLRRGSPATADMLAAICGAGLAFAVYGPPDWTALPRYFAPYLPAALILLWAGLEEAAALLIVAFGKSGIATTTAEEVADRVPLLRGSSAECKPLVGTACKQAVAHGVERRPLILVAIAIVLALANIFDARTKMSQMETFPGYVLAGKNLVGPAQWMRDHLPAAATIATRRIGAVAYYSHRKVFDYTYGLPDPEVARLVARRGARFDTPSDSALETVWRAHAPDYFLEDGVLMDCVIIPKAGGVREHFRIHGIDYRVIREFPIGCGATWVLAGRL